MRSKFCKPTLIIYLFAPSLVSHYTYITFIIYQLPAKCIKIKFK